MRHPITASQNGRIKDSTPTQRPIPGRVQATYPPEPAYPPRDARLNSTSHHISPTVCPSQIPRAEGLHCGFCPFIYPPILRLFRKGTEYISIIYHQSCHQNVFKAGEMYIHSYVTMCFIRLGSSCGFVMHRTQWKQCYSEPSFSRASPETEGHRVFVHYLQDEQLHSGTKQVRDSIIKRVKRRDGSEGTLKSLERNRFAL